MLLHLPEDDFQLRIILIYADKCHIRKVFRNLLSNAIKFTSRGGKIDVKVSHFVTKETSCRVKIDVIDSGAGIPKVCILRLLVGMRDGISIYPQERQASLFNDNLYFHPGTIESGCRSGLDLCSKLFKMSSCILSIL